MDDLESSKWESLQRLQGFFKADHLACCFFNKVFLGGWDLGGGDGHTEAPCLEFLLAVQKKVQKKPQTVMGSFLQSARFKVMGKEGWKWHWSTNGSFLVNNLSKLIQARVLVSTERLFPNSLWSSALPLKVNIFAWRLINNGIPIKPICQNMELL
ncbi:hypothetical protein OSB04_006584 [Centaurea solstitialis]|uniref:Reverse transcriptase zinc-binding domain-containing protein n=1 Tax=Centaurea solstitialis TaxID=347529 RepID=A0AA38WS36_9ASTR|nr:hypothetical protein OSB04_006584 [Centaurea solstitialis]